jgi:monofunctional glycosyltransferase
LVTLENEQKKKRSLLRLIWRFCWKTTMWFFIVTISWVILYRWVNPPVTYLQIREKINCPDGRVFHKAWVNSEDISLYMKLAVVASEDNNFMRHDGFDWGAIEKAKKYNATHTKTRGASTISQQTAKNVFLWPERSWVRKAFEVYFTFLIELFWPKERIMEVYLNVIETGQCKFGVEAAAQDYFHKSAAKLSREQAALIAAILPNPRKRDPSKPTTYLAGRRDKIVRLMRLIGENYFERYSKDFSDDARIKEEKEAEEKISKLPPGSLPEKEVSENEEPEKKVEDSLTTDTVSGIEETPIADPGVPDSLHQE